METHLISIIICTFNTQDLTLSCLDHLKTSILKLNKPVEVVVVENGTDGTGDLIKKKYPWVKLLEPKYNTGFAVGNNLGLKTADPKSKYYLLLNTDVLIQPDTLYQSLRFMEKHPDCDVFGCQLKFADGLIQPSAGFLPTPGNIVFWMLGLDLLLTRRAIHPQQLQFFTKTQPVEWVMGAFMFLKNEVYKTTQGFDENYFMYGEEVELCKRIKTNNFKVFYTSEFCVTHLDKASSKGDIRKGIVKEIQGLDHYLKKYYPASLSWLKLVLRLGMFTRSLVFFVLGNKNRASIHWEALKSI